MLAMGGEVLQPEAGAALDRQGGDVRRADDADGEAVRRRPGQLVEADLAAGAGAVADDDGLAEVALEEAGDGAGCEVGAAVGGGGDDHGERPAGPVGGRGRAGEEQGGDCKQGAALGHRRSPK
jgi:hypothetical protein